jgi:hypothetical protein
MEDNLKELVELYKKKYEFISKVEAVQEVIDLIECRHNCIICVRNYDFSKKFIEAELEIGRCDNDCIDEDDVCGDIIEALKAVKGKYIKAFEELDTEVEESKENGK